MEALLAETGESLQENSLIITREDVYTKAGNESGEKLLSLNEIGFVEGELS